MEAKSIVASCSRRPVGRFAFDVVATSPSRRPQGDGYSIVATSLSSLRDSGIWGFLAQR